MKKSYIISMILLVSLSFLDLFSQIPKEFNYQAVARDSDNNLIANRKISVRFSIIQEDASNPAVYIETHTPLTNQLGLFSLPIGGGEPIAGSFENVNWEKGPAFLKVEMDPSGGSNFVEIGVTKFLSTPYSAYSAYAEYAKNVDDADADPENELQTLTVNGNQLQISGGNSVTLPVSENGEGDNWGSQSVVADKAFEGKGTLGDPLRLSPQNAQPGEALIWDGNYWKPGNLENQEESLWKKADGDANYIIAPQGGIAGSGAVLYGDSSGTHVNLGYGGSVTGYEGANRVYATISGGYKNSAIGSFSAISGGRFNTADSYSSYVGGGFKNRAEGIYSAISGGRFNTADTNYSYVGGGEGNSVEHIYSIVVGGYENVASGYASFVGGGGWNKAGSSNSTIAGGSGNKAIYKYSSITGGRKNEASGFASFVGGGYENSAEGDSSAITGGRENESIGQASFIGGGLKNKALGTYSVISGGEENSADSSYSFIGGGYKNKANGISSTVSGGSYNGAKGELSVIGGGAFNEAVGDYSAVCGGADNYTLGNFSAVCGGEYNSAEEKYSFVGGGYGNKIYGQYSTISGGRRNKINGEMSAIPGGSYLTIEGDGSFGFRGGNPSSEYKLTGDDKFYIMDAQFHFNPSSGNHDFKVDAVFSKNLIFADVKKGCVGIGGEPNKNKFEVHGKASKTTAGDWLANSDRRIKTDIKDIEYPCETLLKLRPVIFKYTDSYLEDNPVIEDKFYYNFIAQEYREVFPESVKGSGQYLENGEEILQIDTYNAQIVSIKAVQELIKENRAQKQEISSQNEEIEDLKQRLSKLEEFMNRTISKND